MLYGLSAVSSEVRSPRAKGEQPPGRMAVAPQPTRKSVTDVDNVPLFIMHLLQC